MGRDRDSAIVRCLNRRRPVWGIIIIGTAVHCGPRTHSNVRTTPTLEWLPWLHGNCKFESQVNLAPAGMPRAFIASAVSATQSPGPSLSNNSYLCRLLLT